MIAPTLDEVRAYCEERGNAVDPEAFLAYYEARGWMLGKVPVKRWQSCVITWEKNDRARNAPPAKPKEKLPSPDRVLWAVGKTDVEPNDDWRTT